MKAKSAGFTLIELMFVIVLAAILLSLGLPSFRDFVRSSRMTAVANDMVADYNLARSEAVKRRVPVTLCQSPDGETCEDTAGTDFKGWIVFIDDADPLSQDLEDGNGEVDDDEEIIRVRSVPDSIESSADGLSTTFLVSGFPDADSAAPLRVLVFCDERGNENSVGGVSAARGIQISATGRTTVSRDKTFIEDELGGCPP
jgi:type IV fimbrial biogenesis protein FimT